MLIGASSALAFWRASDFGTTEGMRATTLAVAGRSSHCSAYGSAFCGSTWPSRACNWYLYLAPAPTPGRKISHTPHSRRRRIGWRRASQKLKSPTTLTWEAFGAQTAKLVPATPSITRCGTRRALR